MQTSCRQGKWLCEPELQHLPDRRRHVSHGPTNRLFRLHWQVPVVGSGGESVSSVLTVPKCPKICLGQQRCCTQSRAYRKQGFSKIASHSLLSKRHKDESACKPASIPIDYESGPNFQIAWFRSELKLRWIQIYGYGRTGRN